MLKPVVTVTAIVFAVAAAGAAGAVTPARTAPATVAGAVQNPAPPAPAPKPRAVVGQQLAVVPAENVGQFRATAALGTEAVDSAGKEVGRIEDLVLNRDGSLAAVVVSVGGLFGIGGKPVAVAAAKTHIVSGEDGMAVEVDVSEAELAAAPRFKTQDEIKSELDSKARGTLQ